MGLMRCLRLMMKSFIGLQLYLLGQEFPGTNGKVTLGLSFNPDHWALGAWVSPFTLETRGWTKRAKSAPRVLYSHGGKRSCWKCSMEGNAKCAHGRSCLSELLFVWIRAYKDVLEWGVCEREGACECVCVRERVRETAGGGGGNQEVSSISTSHWQEELNNHQTWLTTNGRRRCVV